MIDREKIATIINGIRDLIEIDVSSEIVANHVGFVLSGWAGTAVTQPASADNFGSICAELAYKLDVDRGAMLRSTPAQGHDMSIRLHRRAATMAAARDAALRASVQAAA
jgi:hypothetical protein